jgi:hypothetical protein
VGRNVGFSNERTNVLPNECFELALCERGGTDASGLFGMFLVREFVRLRVNADDDDPK